jgi:hypothetical protein
LAGERRGDVFEVSLAEVVQFALCLLIVIGLELLVCSPKRNSL